MKGRMLAVVAGAAVLLCPLGSGCAGAAGMGRCPYALAAVRVVADGGDGALALLELEVENNAPKELYAFSVSVELYDANGELLFEEPIVAEYRMESEADRIAPFTARTCILRLDAFFAEAPEDKLYAGTVFLRTIRYSDGSSWKDPFGLYAGA